MTVNTLGSVGGASVLDKTNTMYRTAGEVRVHDDMVMHNFVIIDA